MPRHPSLDPGIAFVVAVALAALTVGAMAAAQRPSPAAGAPAPSARAAGYLFDGFFRLGTPYSQVAARAPYAHPCDNDPVDGRARRAMVYGGQPCRDHAFAEDTTVVFYLRFAEADADRYEQPIEAFAWMGGHYFDRRSSFPLRVGQPAARAARLGRVRHQLELHREAGSRRARTVVTLVVRDHGNDVWSLAAEDRLVGFVVGPMPSDASNEQWELLMQMYARYTLPR